MQTDIRLYPKKEITFEGMQRIVNEYDGWKCFLSEDIRNGEHAPVYLYTVITPKGAVVRNVDLAIANRIIFSEYIWAHYFDNKRQRIRTI